MRLGFSKGRFIFGISPGALSDKTAERYGRGDPASPYRFYWDKLRGNMLRAKRHVIFKLHEQEDDSAVTLERLLDQLVLCGTVTANEVMPRVNRAIGVSESGAAA